MFVFCFCIVVFKFNVCSLKAFNYCNVGIGGLDGFDLVSKITHTQWGGGGFGVLSAVIDCWENSWGRMFARKRPRGRRRGLKKIRKKNRVWLKSVLAGDYDVRSPYGQSGKQANVPQVVSRKGKGVYRRNLCCGWTMSWWLRITIFSILILGVSADWTSWNHVWVIGTDKTATTESAQMVCPHTTQVFQ